MNNHDSQHAESDSSVSFLPEKQLDEQYKIMLDMLDKLLLNCSSDDTHKPILYCYRCGKELIFQNNLGLVTNLEDKPIVCGACHNRLKKSD